MQLEKYYAYAISNILRFLLFSNNVKFVNRLAAI